MKILRYPVANPSETEIVTIEEFAEKHDLTMEVREREFPEHKSCRYFARFEKTWTKVGGLLHGTFGNGETEKEAIDNYALKISGVKLVKDPDNDTRLVIHVPELKS